MHVKGNKKLELIWLCVPNVSPTSEDMKPHIIIIIWLLKKIFKKSETGTTARVVKQATNMLKVKKKAIDLDQTQQANL